MQDPKHRAPIHMLLHRVTWVEVPPGDKRDAMFNGDVPYATHSGVMEVFGHSLRVYRLSNGQAVIHADDMSVLFDLTLPSAYGS